MLTAPTWAYDALWTCRALDGPTRGVTAAEMQVFAYLACLVSIYDQRNVADWGYTFTATPAGSPYAKRLAETSDRLRARGLIVDRLASQGRRRRAPVPDDVHTYSATPTVLTLSSLGEQEFTALSRLPSCRDRERYLETATSAAQLMPLPSVSDAVTYEPNLRRALNRVATTELLDEDGVAVITLQFEAVAEALRGHSGTAQDLLVPIAVWVSFLAETADAERRAA